MSGGRIDVEVRPAGADKTRPYFLVATRKTVCRQKRPRLWLILDVSAAVVYRELGSTLSIARGVMPESRHLLGEVRCWAVAFNYYPIWIRMGIAARLCTRVLLITESA